MQMANTSYPPIGPLSLDSVKFTFDGQQFGGFAFTLRQVLRMLGVPTELMKYTCPGKPAREGGLEGYVVTLLEVPASQTLPVPAFTETTVEETMEEGLQAVSLKALRTVMRDAYEYLRTTEFRLLPQALNLHLNPNEQALMSSQLVFTEEDPCLHVSAYHLLE